MLDAVTFITDNPVKPLVQKHPNPPGSVPWFDTGNTTSVVIVLQLFNNTFPGKTS